MAVRRIVTGYDGNGRSKIVSDSEPPRTHYYDQLPGHMTSIVWGTPYRTGEEDPTVAMTNVIPGPGGTTMFLVTFPPAGEPPAHFDPAAFRAEQTAATPGLTDHFDEEEDSQFHATPTLDYIVVLDGEIWLVLEEDEALLKAGDIVIQDGTGHAWQNRSDAPVTFACVMAPR